MYKSLPQISAVSLFMTQALSLPAISICLPSSVTCRSGREESENRSQCVPALEKGWEAFAGLNINKLVKWAGVMELLC